MGSVSVSVTGPSVGVPEFVMVTVYVNGDPTTGDPDEDVLTTPTSTLAAYRIGVVSPLKTKINALVSAKADPVASSMANRERIKCKRARTGEMFIAKRPGKAAEFFPDIRISPREWN